ncbi:universal stress protein [Streptomyces sp. cmx-18-6]|uniref:universal stress protein n=1 Tax=Streptomyces sp. cmx-18-6 TaxID=2790930 RepID=UPI0039816939
MGRSVPIETCRPSPHGRGETLGAGSRLGSPESRTSGEEGAGPVVVGRRGSRPAGPHIGHVTHAVIHHSTAPVAVVPCE